MGIIMAFIAHITQYGEGCDYTIACAQKLIKLRAETMEQAITELTETIREQYTDDRQLERAVIYEVVDSLNVDLDSLYAEYDAEAEMREAERAQQRAEAEAKAAAKKLADLKARLKK